MLTKKRAIQYVIEELLEIEPEEDRVKVTLQASVAPLQVVTKWMNSIQMVGTKYSQPEVNALLYVAQGRKDEFFNGADPSDAREVLNVLREWDKELLEVLSGGGENPEPSTGLELVDEETE